MTHHLVYGLSADPIHRAHSDLLCDAAAALFARGYALSGAMVVPVYRRNLPKRGHSAPYEHRLAMCQLAAEAVGPTLALLGVRVEVSRIEQELAAGSDRPNYTVETLAALRQADPSAGLIFLMSSDLVSGDDPEFARWHRPEDIVRLAVMAVAVRHGYPQNGRLLEKLTAAGGEFVLLAELSPADMSAQDIRARIAAGEDPLRLADEGLLLPAVAGYIHQHGLYSEPQT